MRLITVKYLELTTHDPLLKLVINCKLKIFIVSAARENIIFNLEISCLFLSSILARIPVSATSMETRKNKSTRVEIFHLI